MAEDQDPQEAIALARYQVISAYVALAPGRGQRRLLLEQLAAKTWTAPDGEPMHVAAETIRTWIRRYRAGGLGALRDKPRPRRGIQVLSAEQIALACQLKREVPARSVDRVLRILESTGQVPPGQVRRSTLHRALQQNGLSARHNAVPDREDLDRFEADAPNDLWQSDLLIGPWLPDPDRPGKMRRAGLYAFLDDHSRLLLHGRFSFKGELPALELVFRRCLQKYGVCRRVYYDNGQVYRSGHMRHTVATLGIHRIVFTQRHRPMGHGKIEALNRLMRSAFIAEVSASRITTLDQLNEAFLAWADLEYNRKSHSETGEAPLARWRAGAERVRYADEEQLRQAFLWREHRTPDKSGVFGLFGLRYQVGPALARRRIEVRYDPENLGEVEVWCKDKFAERVRPFEVYPHRRPRPALPAPATPTTPVAPTVDWLAHLVAERSKTAFLEPDPRAHSEAARARREQADQEIVDLLTEHLDGAVLDLPAVRAFLDRYGPFDAALAASVLDQLLDQGGRIDEHVTYYLEAIRASHRRGGSP